MNELLIAARHGSDRDIDTYLEVSTTADIRKAVLEIADNASPDADRLARAAQILRQGSDEFGRYGNTILQAGMLALADEIETAV